MASERVVVQPRHQRKRYGGRVLPNSDPPERRCVARPPLSTAPKRHLMVSDHGRWFRSTQRLVGAIRKVKATEARWVWLDQSSPKRVVRTQHRACASAGLVPVLRASEPSVGHSFSATRRGWRFAPPASFWVSDDSLPTLIFVPRESPVFHPDQIPCL